MENFRRLRVEQKEKQEEAESRNLNNRYTLSKTQKLKTLDSPFGLTPRISGSSKSSFLNSNIPQDV